MAGAYSRNKGANFEREVVNKFKEEGYAARRTSPLQAGHGTNDTSDVTVYWSDARGNSRSIKVECKRKASQVVDAAQVLRDNPVDIVAHRKDRDSLMISIPFPLFACILKWGYDQNGTENLIKALSPEVDDAQEDS